MKIDTNFAELLISHYSELQKEGYKRLWHLQKFYTDNISLDDLNIKKDTLTYSHYFSLQSLKTEIQKNILNITEEENILKYFHFLIKIEWNLKDISRNAKHGKKLLKGLKHYDEQPWFNFGSSSEKYYSVIELHGHCNFLLNSSLHDGLNLHLIIKEEFRYDIEKWKELITKRKSISPSYEDVKWLFDIKGTSIIENPKDKLSTKQQILLMHKLGILDLPVVQKLTEQKKGILFGYLLNRHDKNTEDTIRNRFSNYPEKIKNPVLELLKELDIEKL